MEACCVCFNIINTYWRKVCPDKEKKPRSLLGLQEIQWVPCRQVETDHKPLVPLLVSKVRMIYPLAFRDLKWSSHSSFPLHLGKVSPSTVHYLEHLYSVLLLQMNNFAKIQKCLLNPLQPISQLQDNFWLRQDLFPSEVTEDTRFIEKF